MSMPVPAPAFPQQQPQQQRFRVRRVPFPPHTLPRPVMLQSANGPCPLLAIVNVLLLRGQLNVNADVDEVSEAALLQGLANRALELEAERERGRPQRRPARPPTTGAAARATAAAGGMTTPAEAAAHVARANKAWHIGELMELLPGLARGLDVNVRFDGVHAFESTAALTAFDALGVRLLHGWLLDPQDRRTARALQLQQPPKPHDAGGTPISPPSSASYNSATAQLVAYRALLEEHDALGNPAAVPTSSLALPCPSDEAEARRRRRLLRDGPVIEEFLAATAGQLTVYGLVRLHEEMAEGELAAFFRNNHFSVLHKRGGRLFVLASDEGFLHEPRAVWERLDEPTGDVEYVDGYFQPLFEPAKSPYTPAAAAVATPPPLPPAAAVAAAASASSSSSEEAADRLLALQLQEDQAAAARDGRAAFQREGVEALLMEGAPLELLRAQDPGAVVPPPRAAAVPAVPASALAAALEGEEKEEEGAMVEGDFWLVPGRVGEPVAGGAVEAKQGEGEVVVVVDPETDRPFSPEEVAAMRAAEQQFRRAKEESEREREKRERRQEDDQPPGGIVQKEDGPVVDRAQGGGRRRRPRRPQGGCAVQ